MRTLTACCRAVVPAALGLVLSVSLVACAQLGIGAPRHVSCSLLFIPGDLVADDGRVVLLAGHEIIEPPYGRPVSLDWPDGWTVRPADDGELEVVDTTGALRARTGAGIVLFGVADPDGSGPWIRDGALVVCPGAWPDNDLDPDDIEPTGVAP